MGNPAPLAVEVWKVSDNSAETQLSAAGELRPFEAIAVSAELPRRLVRVHVADGARVAKGALLFELDNADLLAKQRELTVRRKLALSASQRQQKLAAEGIGSAADAEQAQSALEVLDAEMGTLRVTLDRTQIRAPFGGKVGLRTVSPGAIVAVGQPLISLVDDSKLRLEFSVPERYTGRLLPGAPITFTVANLPNPTSAIIDALEPNVDSASRSMRGRATVVNADGKLSAGAFAAVGIALKAPIGGVRVPSVAVIPGMGGHSVWIAADGKAQRRKVELSGRDAEQVEIKSGLKVGDWVILTNLLRLREGVPVTATPAPTTVPQSAPTAPPTGAQP